MGSAGGPLRQHRCRGLLAVLLVRHQPVLTHRRRTRNRGGAEPRAGSAFPAAAGRGLPPGPGYRPGPAGRGWRPGPAARESRHCVMLQPRLPRFPRVPGGAMTGPIAPSHIPAGATQEGDGILTGDGPVRVDAFIDFLCPFCKQFELSSGPALAGLIADGQISLVYHPMNFLDEASTTSYSTRAAAASGCAADQGKFLPYAHELFVRQPPEGGPGLSDAELADIGDAVGLS